jgi:hypothetical protein
VEVLFGLLCFLIGTALVLAVVAVIGHGIWVMVAAIFSGGSRRRAIDGDRPSRRRAFQPCVGCGEKMSSDDYDCPACGLDPDSDAADELKDLDAAERTIDRLFEEGTLAAESRRQISTSIEAHRESLLPRRRRTPKPEPTPITQLEEWFGDDQGSSLSVEQKQGALAMLRSVQSGELSDLSPRALLGIARLQASVGMLSRACQVYRVLFHCYARDRISTVAAVEAIQTACKLEDWPSADDFVRAVSGVPGMVEKQPELAMLLEQVRMRDVGAASAPAAPEAQFVVNEIQPVAETPIVYELQPAYQTPTMHAVAPVSLSDAREETMPTPIETPEPAAPRRSFAEWIAVFMEERNILWGELIGGTLIVGCSIALVISLWQTLEKIEFFPFIILAAITSALFGAGFYTLHHWKLESTSRGLLLIGTLLVPLDFLVLAGLTRTSEAGIVDYLLGGAALTLFGWLLYRSSLILIETPLELPMPSALLVTSSMLVSAGMQLVALGGLANQGWQPHFLYPLSLLPVLGQVAAIGWILLRLRSIETWSIGRLVALLIALGSVTFACSVTIGFPLFDADNLTNTLMHLAPALTLLGVPILIAGTLIHQKLAPVSETDHEKHGLWRTLGTALALAGLFVMFGGFAVSVDEPIHRWVCGSINIVTLLAVAWILRVPALHVPAQVYLAVLVVVGGSFDFDAMRHSPHAALRLTGLLVVQAIVAEALIRLQRRVDARFYALGSGVSTVLAGILIAPFALTSPGITALVLGAAALTWFTANLRWHYAGITYGCALVLAGAVFFAFRHYAPDSRFPEQLLWSLLTHATICLLASVLLRFTSIDWLHNFFRIPLQFASLFATFFAGAIILGEQFPATLSWSVSCIACVWLATLWLTIAVLEGWPILFGAFQVVLGVAWIFGAGDWLTWYGWDWREPYSLHVYALGLGFCSLLWEVSRIAARSQPRAMALLTPPFVPVDRLLTGGLILGQYVLSLSVVLWSVGRELSFTPEHWRVLPEAWHDNAYSIGAWLLPVLLTGVLIVWLREFDWQLPLLGFTLLALTIPLLAAGAFFESQKAAASATRWDLALCYGACSLLLWYRQRLGAERSERVPTMAIRALLAVGAVGPILFITLYVVVQKLNHQPLPGPLAGSIFLAMGDPVSLLIPLALLSATLAGHGFRERLAYYLLAAGLLANASSVGAFFLAVPRDALGESWVAVDAFLLAAATAWIWSIVWTWIASLLETDETKPLLDSPLLAINACLGALLYFLAMSRAVEWIMVGNDEPGRLWTQAAGSLWSWSVYGLMSAGSCYLFWKRRASLPLHLLGVLSLTAIGLIACSVEVLWPDHSFVALMFLSGVYACVWVWSNLLLDPRNPPRWLTFSDGLWESVVYACIASAGAVFLGCSALVNDRNAVWCAESVVLVALAGALLAYQRKTEIWASLASLLMMLASTILALHFGQAMADGELLTMTIHVNVAVLGAMSLLWLGLHRFLAPPAVELSHLRLLPVQISLGMLANLVLLYLAMMALVFGWDHPELYSGWAWPALVTNAIAAVWYVGEVRRRAVVHAVALSGLLLGIVLAGSADVLLPGTWAAHHVLTLSWTLLGLLLLALSWVSHAQQPRPQGADFLRTCFPEAATRAWVTLCSAFVVVLALQAAWVEPATPYWSVGNTFAVSVLLGALAIWSGAAIYLVASGLLFNVIGFLLYSAWVTHHPNLADDERFSYLLLAQVVSFGSAAIVWSLLERVLHQRNIDISHGIAPFTQAAIFVGVLLLAGQVFSVNGMHLNGEAVHVGSALAWISLGVLVAAALLERWRPHLHRYTRFQVYASGLLAIGIFLHGMSLSVADWQWAATVLLAAYVLLIVALLRLMEFAPSLTHQAPTKPDSSGHWLWHVQLVTIGVVLVFSMWIALTFPTWQARLGGALASSLVTLAAFLLVPAWPRIFPAEEGTPAAFGLQHRLFPCYLVLMLGVIVALETCGAFLGPEMNAHWLQRNAAALPVFVAALLIYRFVVPRCMAGSSWIEPSRALSAILGVGGVILLVMLLGREIVMYDAALPVRATPLHLDLVIAAGLAMLGLTVLALYSALTKDQDPFGIEKDRRSLYVYLAELLALACFAHLRLNLPHIFTGLIGQYWYLVVMVIAFAWVSLSEIFKRLELPILATPLKRSAMVLAFIPVLAFRVAALAGLKLADAVVPNTTVVPMEAVCWLLLGIFFGSLSRLQKSANYGIAAALAINFGVWVLLGHQEATKFLERPQLWLIPLGLIVLVAEYINRSRLGFWPGLSVRYGGLLCIYLSSTIEMFKELVHSNPIFPIVLAGLAVAGMLLGILFRVRAFLLSGFMALLIVIFAQIWNAAVFHSQTWVWWACGIVLGVIILVMFALFEKHRNEVVKMLDNMKRWQ